MANITYEFMSVNGMNDNDYEDLNALLQAFSPGTRHISISVLQHVLPCGRVQLARDTDTCTSEQPFGRVVGTATLVRMETFTGPYGYIEDVVVDEIYRGQGIGEKLTLNLIEDARRQGFDCIDLTSNPTRVAANQLYLKLGFQKRDTNCYRLTL